MPPRLEYQHYYEPEYDEQQQEDAFPPSGVLLIPGGDAYNKKEKSENGA
jgi:hypothetical protein